VLLVVFMVALPLTQKALGREASNDVCPIW
jgi:hypothetical protein